MLDRYARLNDFLAQHSPSGTFLFDDFGLAETVFTPFFMRFWFLEYYEDFDLPRGDRYARVREWRDACLAHPAAGQVTEEQVVKLYYDYARARATVPCSRAAPAPLSPSTRPGPPAPGRPRTSTRTPPRTRSWASPKNRSGPREKPPRAAPSNLSKAPKPEA